jgi:hypothetical protein
VSDDDGDLRAILATLDPKARDDLRRVLIHDRADRDAIASQLLRYRDELGDGWADIIDVLTMHPEARRQVVRLLGRSTPGIDQPQIRPRAGRPRTSGRRSSLLVPGAAEPSYEPVKARWTRLLRQMRLLSLLEKLLLMVTPPLAVRLRRVVVTAAHGVNIALGLRWSNERLSNPRPLL